MSSVLFFNGNIFDSLGNEKSRHTQQRSTNRKVDEHHGHQHQAGEFMRRDRQHVVEHVNSPFKGHYSKATPRHHSIERKSSELFNSNTQGAANESITGFMAEGEQLSLNPENDSQYSNLLSQWNAKQTKGISGNQLNSTSDRSRLLIEEFTELWQISTPIEESIITDRVARLKSLLHLNGISKSTFKSYCVRVLDNAILLPRYSQTDAFQGLDFTPSGIKVYRYADISSNPNPVSVDVLPRENVYNGMFGYNLINPSDPEVVLTSREADAMAVYQATKYTLPSLVLPGNAGPLSYDALPYLEQFRKIILWLPVHQFNSVQNFARRLNTSRCFVVTGDMSTHSPAELLSVGNINIASEKITHLLNTAKPAVFSEDVDTFESLRISAKEHVFGTGQVAGIVQWARFPLLNQILKGFRLGELTILTGQAGCGKTTFLSEYSLDLCEQNIATLWCSFEIPNSRLVSILVHQYARKEFVHNSVDFDVWYDKLLKMPMFFAKFEQGIPLQKISDEIDSLIMNRNIQHVIVDNLQYMLENTDAKSADQTEYLKLQDSIAENFHTLAKLRHVHLTLVVYPSAVAEEQTNIDLLLGSLKTSQQADNILLIQRKIFRIRGESYFEKYLQVCKNRFAGEIALGERLQMFFDIKSKCHRLSARPRKSAHRE